MKLFKTFWCASSWLLCSRSIFAFSNTAASATSPADTETSKHNSNMSSGSSFAYTPGSSSVAFVTTPDDNLAKKLARGLIEQKLAACVNIIPNIQSIYMWEGKVNEDNEVLMMIKTRTSRMEELMKYVRENHSYSVAEVITFPIEAGNIPYLDWIAKTVPDKN